MNWIKNLFLSIVLCIPFGMTGNAPMDAPPAEMNYDELNEMAKMLFPDMSEEEREMTISQTIEMDQHLQSLTPEERAEEERKMISELNETLGLDIPLDAAQPPVEEKKEKPKATVVEKKETKQPKTKVEAIKIKVKELTEILENFNAKTDTLTIKDSSKKIITPAEWIELQEDLTQAISYLTIVSNKDELLDGLLASDQSELKDAIEKAIDNLLKPVKEIDVPDTMGLRDVVTEKGDVLYASETTGTDKIASQKHFKEAIKYLRSFLTTYKANWALKRLIEKYAPAELKKKQAPAAKKTAPSYTAPSYPGGQGGGGYGGGPGYYPGGQGGYQPPRGSYKRQPGSRGSQGSGSSTDKGSKPVYHSKNKKDGDKKDEDKKKTKDEKSKDQARPGVQPRHKKQQKPRAAKSPDALKKDIEGFVKIVGDIDKKIKDNDLTKKIVAQSASDNYDTELHQPLYEMEVIDIPRKLKKLIGKLEAAGEALSKEEQVELKTAMSEIFNSAPSIHQFVVTTIDDNLEKAIKRHEQKQTSESRLIVEELKRAQLVGTHLDDIKKKITFTEKQSITNAIDALEAEATNKGGHSISKQLVQQEMKQKVYNAELGAKVTKLVEGAKSLDYAVDALLKKIKTEDSATQEATKKKLYEALESQPALTRLKATITLQARGGAIEKGIENEQVAALFRSALEFKKILDKVEEAVS